MRKVVCVFVLLFAVMSVSANSAAYADGKYYPPDAIQQEPTIPSQSALLIYRNGIERLAIENNLKAGEGEFGWVLPLPAEPTEINPVPDGVFSELMYATAPIIVTTSEKKAEFLKVFGVVMLLSILVILLMRVYRKSKLGALLLASFFALVYTFFIPTFLGSRAGTSALTEVTVLSQASAGNYDISSLRAKTSSALNEWLKGNGFAALTAPDLKIVDSYIAEGWVFVASKLKKVGDGQITVHPLEFVFPAKKPVYPMRLTATATDELDLKLYVVSDCGSTCDALQLDYRTHTTIADEIKCSDKVKYTNVTDGLGSLLVHPYLVGNFWDGAVLERYTGVLDRDDMKRDVLIDPMSVRGNAFVQTYHTRDAAVLAAFADCLPIGAVLFFVCWIVMNAVWKGRSLRNSAFAFLYTAGVFLIVSFLLFSATPRINAQVSELSARSLYFAYQDLSCERMGQVKTIDEASEKLKGLLAKNDYFRDDSKPYMKEGTQYGNYFLVECNGRILVIARNASFNPRYATGFYLTE